MDMILQLTDSQEENLRRECINNREGYNKPSYVEYVNNNVPGISHVTTGTSIEYIVELTFISEEHLLMFVMRYS